MPRSLELKIIEKDKYNRKVNHPLQSWQWGEFRKKTGVKVVRRTNFQLTIHPLPHLPYTIGYLPKGPLPTQKMLKELASIGRNNRCIFIKLEPNVEKENCQIPITNHQLRIGKYKLLSSPHPLFPKYTFQIDLTKSEDQLMKKLNSKTRYNVRLAKRKGVVVEEDNSDKAFKTYLKLMFETTKRQGFYAHDERYHQLMWQTLGPESSPSTPIAHLLTAKYKGTILVTWILFLFKDTLYYPYGASSAKHRNLMASNLMMWEAIRWGKKHGAKIFDLWGCLGPNPDKNHPWYGFHRFKKGYGPRLVEFIGSWDLVLKPTLYRIYNIAYRIRWSILQPR